MTISEEEIFKYVLFPDNLSNDVKEYIKKNENLFSVQIDFYKSYISSFNSDEISGLADKAIRKIPLLQNIIILYPVVNKNIHGKKSLTLAAASQEIAAKQSESITYSDENSKYLVRLIRDKEKSILFFFSKTEDKDKKLKITFLPSHEILHIENTSQQIGVSQFDEIEKIMIEEE